jgi:hypothetical protein
MIECLSDKGHPKILRRCANAALRGFVFMLRAAVLARCAALVFSVDLFGVYLEENESCFFGKWLVPNRHWPICLVVRNQSSLTH